MTMIGKIVRVSIAVGACSALAGCLGGAGGAAGGGGGGGSGGGGGGLTVAQFGTEMSRIQNTIATTDMPASGTATFDGTIKTDLRKGANVVGDLLGDLSLTVDFAQAGTDGSVTGQATNFRGTVNGQPTTYAGTLTTADAAAKSLPSVHTVTTDTFNAPIVGPITTRTGAISVSLTGDLEVGGVDGAVVLNPGGSFVGAGAQAMWGPVVGTWWGPQGPSEYTVAGTWFAER
jgi:hypothetical protein